MSIERWSQAPMTTTHADLLRVQPQFIEITDTGAAGNLNSLDHNLGRVPRGVRIVNSVLSSIQDNTAFRLDTDDAWTDRHIGVRFTADNARVLLEVF